ncbi:MAG: hypothetical protein WC374_01490 [Phycisphaerae bacterium]
MTDIERLNALKDECVIYYSPEDTSWIAHSLNTDQIGFGDCVVDAIVDLMVGVSNLLELAEKKDVAVIVQAPEEIQRLRDSAKRLPNSITQIAKEKFYHQLSSEWSFQFRVPQSDCVTTSLPLEELYV